MHAQLLLLVTFIFVCPELFGQQSDHLNMTLDFQDSVAHITASYHLAERNNDSVYFLLNPEFKIHSITADGLKSFELGMKEGRPFPFWILTFEGLPEDRNDVITFEYEIDLSQQNHMRSEWIELNADKLWQPNTDLNNRFSYELTVNNLPPGYSFTTHTDARVDYSNDQIIAKKEEPWYEVLFLAGNQMRNWSYDDDITIIGNVEIPESTLESMGDKVRKSINLLNESIGTSEPIKDFTVVLRNTSRDEIGYQVNRKNLIITGVDFNDIANISHEVAHFWWSKANFIKEPWMNESFANFSMYKVLETYDAESYQRLIEKHRDIAKEAIPVAEATSFTENAFPSYYYKGAVLLVNLEKKIGEDRMNQLLSSCIEKEITTTRGFLIELANMTSQETSDTFAESLKM